MVNVIVVIREVGRLKPEYSLTFELPEVPRVGDYISITRPDTPEPFSEDVVVRKIWWRLHHPETAGSVSADDVKSGSLKEIFVECDQAIGPYSLDSWHDRLTAKLEAGEDIETFEIARLSVRQSDLAQMK